jgi:hypothetical protein
LGAKVNEGLHQRLQKRKGKERFRVVKKLGRQKNKNSRLTSSKGGVAEPPAKLNSSPSSTLALFGEEARGLVAGVDL